MALSSTPAKNVKQKVFPGESFSFETSVETKGSDENKKTYEYLIDHFAIYSHYEEYKPRDKRTYVTLKNKNKSEEEEIYIGNRGIYEVNNVEITNLTIHPQSEVYLEYTIIEKEVKG